MPERRDDHRAISAGGAALMLALLYGGAFALAQSLTGSVILGLVAALLAPVVLLVLLALLPARRGGRGRIVA